MGDQDVQAFEFASAEEADSVAGTVSADGSSIGTSMVGWLTPPHFYKSGKLIVIYVGSDGDVIDALQEAMGTQFEGATAKDGEHHERVPGDLVPSSTPRCDPRQGGPPPSPGRWNPLRAATASAVGNSARSTPNRLVESGISEVSLRYY